jgi:hypothetical protein
VRKRIRREPAKTSHQLHGGRNFLDNLIKTKEVEE